MAVGGGVGRLPDLQRHGQDRAYGTAGQEDREPDIVLTQDRGHKYIKLVVSPYVAAFLRKGIWSLRRRWEWKYKLRLHVVEDQSLGIVEVHYHDDKDNDLINK